jgi:hypothetical protein
VFVPVIFVIVTGYLFNCACLFVIVFIYFVQCWTLYSFCSSISFFIDSFAFTIRCSLFQRKKCNSDPELCLGILILLFQYTSSSIRLNKHHTADSTGFVLVYERRTYYDNRHSETDGTKILQIHTAVEGETVTLYINVPEKKNSNLLADCQDLKGQCHEHFYWFFFFIKQLLVPLDMPRKDLEFLRFFKELFVFVINSPVYSPPRSRDSKVYSPPGSPDSPVYSSPGSPDSPVYSSLGSLGPPW